MNKLIELINGGDYLLVVLVVLGAVVFNFRAIVDFFEERNKARISKLTEALQCEHLSELTKIHLQEELATEHFKRSTGIRAEKQLRDALIKVHKNTNGELRFEHFKRAIRYLSFKDNQLTVHISKYEEWSFRYNMLFGVVFAFLGLILFSLTGFVGLDSTKAIINYVSISMFICTIGAFMLFETLPMFSARCVQKELEKSVNELENVKVNKLDG